MPDNHSFSDLLETLLPVVRNAAEAVMSVYATDFSVRDKDDASPVTEADERAEAVILAGLAALAPDVPVVAEEAVAAGRVPTTGERFWLVDPLDGTKEFIKHNGEFAVHVGLAVSGEARAGVVYRPVGARLYAGAVGEGCHLEEGGTRRELRLPNDPPDTLRLITSRSHRSRKLVTICEELGIEQVTHMGSVGLKCGMLAEGRADLYVHASKVSSRWDSCAPEAVVRAAGGVFTDMAGVRYRYDGSELENVRGIVACSAAVLARVLPVVERVGREGGILP